MPDATKDNQSVLSGLSQNILATQSILDVFVLQDIIDLGDASKLKERFRTNREIEDFLLRNRLITRETINKAYSILLKLPYISFENVQIPIEVLKLIPEKLAQKYRVISFNITDKLVRLAVARPSDLLARYPEGLEKFFRDRNLSIELFITGEVDFNNMVKQYHPNKNDILIKQGSLPVVYLRNQLIYDKYLKKIPVDFVKKYRIAVFGENRAGEYLVACEEPDSPVTKKILDFLKSENDIKVELFATAKDDINYILALQTGQSAAASSPREDGRVSPGEIESGPRNRDEKISIKGLLGGLLDQKSEPELTIDSAPQVGKIEQVKAGIIQANQDRETTLAEKSTQTESDEITQVQKKKLEGLETEVDQTKQFTYITDKKPDIKETIKKDQNEEDIAAHDPPSESTQQKLSHQENQAKSAFSALEENDVSKILGGIEVTNVLELAKVAESGYVPKIVAAIVDFAVNNKASDIHMEPGLKHVRIRCRIDGVLEDVLKTEISMHPQMITRIKIMSKLKIDESRIPQDGRFGLIVRDRKVDVRVSTLPTVNGEKIVMRVLDKDSGILSLEDLGMQGSAFDATVNAISKPYGIILSTGPTGSGKSTTLYAVLSRLSVPGINIVTLEDPVEYEIPGVNQCQVKPEIGFTFASGLRSVLRQDPNVIMVGEIRDAETASMATHAALTGHLVLSTLHTNDTSNALPRLINMGVEAFLITSSINLVIAQRLARKICPVCKEETHVPAKLLDEIKKELEAISPKNTRDRERIPAELHFYHGKGCSKCTHGYKGRVGLFEVMDLTPEIEDLAIAKRSAGEIKLAALKDGMITMRQDGLIKALSGLTTIDEVFQQTGEK